LGGREDFSQEEAVPSEIFFDPGNQFRLTNGKEERLFYFGAPEVRILFGQTLSHIEIPVLMISWLYRKMMIGLPVSRTHGAVLELDVFGRAISWVFPLSQQDQIGTMVSVPRKANRKRTPGKKARAPLFYSL